MRPEVKALHEWRNQLRALYTHSGRVQLFVCTDATKNRYMVTNGKHDNYFATAEAAIDFFEAEGGILPDAPQRFENNEDFRRALRASGLSQNQAARLLRCCRSQVSHYVNDKRSAKRSDVDTVLQYCARMHRSRLKTVDVPKEKRRGRR